MLDVSPLVIIEEDNHDSLTSFWHYGFQNLPYLEMVERYQHIEALGYDSAWVADHFVDPYVPDKPWFDAWTILAALAARTTKIQLGAMVTNIIYRNPSVFAKQALTIDHISNGE